MEKENRQTTMRIVARVTPAEHAEVKAAIGSSLEAWMGMSHFIRMAVLHWARGVNSERRARAIREQVVEKRHA